MEALSEKEAVNLMDFKSRQSTAPPSGGRVSERVGGYLTSMWHVYSWFVSLPLRGAPVAKVSSHVEVMWKVAVIASHLMKGPISERLVGGGQFQMTTVLSFYLTCKSPPLQGEGFPLGAEKGSFYEEKPTVQILFNKLAEARAQQLLAFGA